MAAWHSLPAPPQLDERRWFHALLATLALHEVEATGGDEQQWEERVASVLPRDTWPDGPRLSLLDDPIELGVEYDPGAWLGAGRGWAGLADAEATRAAIRDRVRQRWILLGHHPLFDALAGEADSLTVEGGDADAVAAADALYATLTEQHHDNAQRYVLVGAGAHAHTVARAMVRHAGLRDQVDAVIAVDGHVAGAQGEHQAWLGERFTHTALDREQIGRTPWLSLRGEAHPAQGACWPMPPADRDEIWGVEPVDLGVVRCDAAAGLVARSLVTLTALRALSLR